MTGKTALGWIEEKKRYLHDINDKIWGFAEVGLQEYKSSSLLAEELEKAGFTVVRGVADMPTAFTATWGSGGPRIGFLAEYDALPHLSQKVVAYREPVQAGAPGHGCGHNTYGTGVLGGVLALQEEMKKDSLSGTIIFYGCPAEETLIGKVFMAREGLFDDLDCALTWHPTAFNTTWLSSGTAVNSAKFTFYGRTSHAADDPHLGRSALDAVELMNVGVNYLREHVIQEARIHYVTTNGGGAPNVVPPEAQVWYYVRAPRREDVDDIFERVNKVAAGAAMMTETRYELEILTACYSVLSNKVLSDLLYESLVKIGPPKWTDEDIQLAKDLTATFEPGGKEAVFRATGAPPEYLDKYLDDAICKPYDEGKVGGGSTDVADVSWVTPTAQFMTCCSPLGCPGHSWQMVVASGSSLAHKGLELAAKTLALSGSKLLRNPELSKKAREEFAKATAGRPYRCAVPPEAKPPFKQLPEQF